MNKEQATQLILAAISQFNEIHRSDHPIPVAPDTRLFGQGGQLDSLDLVRFVFLVEETVQEKTGKNIALTDEKAMSQRTSPFASVTSLADYIVTLTSHSS
jgi:acyl carrier protein